MKKKTYKMKLVKRRYHRINMSVYIILKYSQYKLEALAKHIKTHSEIFHGYSIPEQPFFNFTHPQSLWQLRHRLYTLQFYPIGLPLGDRPVY